MFFISVVGPIPADGSTGPSGQRTYILTSEPVRTQSRLVNFKLYPANTGVVYLQIWRKSSPTAGANSYKLVYSQKYQPTQIGNNITVIDIRKYFYLNGVLLYYRFDCNFHFYNHI